MPDYKVHMLAFADSYVVRTVTVPYVGSTNGLLDDIYHHGQNDFQPRQCPSVSKGDVIEVDGRCFIVQSIGFREITTEELIGYVLTPRIDRHFHPLTSEPKP